jgi:AcrR family transcriptional regulator
VATSTRDAPPRRWARTDATQQRILNAATDVFGSHGFTAATMADVVENSGASIGSIYHHFGGKRELFLAIFERMAADIERRTAQSHTAAEDPRRAFEMNTRAYLQAVWANREAAKVLASGDTPAGFDAIRRDSMLANFRRRIASLDLDSSSRGRLMSRILIAVLAESSMMVALCDDPVAVEPIIDATVESIARLIS